MRKILDKEYGIPRRYLGTIMSPWAAKRLHEFGGDITQFRVVKVWPSILEQIAIAKTEPGDENNQDISALVGKVDIRKLENYAQNDPDAYGYSGALCRANQGIMEFVEMFKAPIKVLHPLLTATQEGNYNGTEGISALPFNGIILAHSNESEWVTASVTTRTTRPSLTASTSSRCLTACASPKRSKFTKNCSTTVSCRTRHARRARWKRWRASPSCRA